jgi:non-ribosomal peptide synthetase component F
MASSLHSRPVQGRELSSDRGTLGFSIMCVHDLVALQAHAVPDAVAIIGGDKKLTYGEMNARANHLANLLRSRGIKASSGEWEQRDPRDDHQLFERTAPSAGIADGTRGCGDEVRAAGNHQRLI